MPNAWPTVEFANNNNNNNKENEAMFCASCGAGMDDRAVACPRCGAPVNGRQVVVAPAGATVPNHMVGAILTTLFCCLIGGIIAIIYASQVNTKLAQGDIEGAKAASRTAGGWIIANIVVGLIGSLLYALIVGFAVLNQ